MSVCVTLAASLVRQLRELCFCRMAPGHGRGLRGNAKRCCMTGSCRHPLSYVDREPPTVLVSALLSWEAERNQKFTHIRYFYCEFDFYLSKFNDLFLPFWFYFPLIFPVDREVSFYSMFSSFSALQRKTLHPGSQEHE